MVLHQIQSANVLFLLMVEGMGILKDRLIHDLHSTI